MVSQSRILVRLVMMLLAVLAVMAGSGTAMGDDCNSNGIDDQYDVADGTSWDLDANGVPDECQADCNVNDIPDDWEIAAGTATDTNTNGIPDVCDMGMMLTRAVDIGLPPMEEIVVALAATDSGVPPYEELMLIQHAIDSGVPPWEELMVTFAATDAGVPPYEELMWIAEDVYRRVLEHSR